MASHPIHSVSIYRFGIFRVDLRSRELRKNGIPLRLQGKPFQVLIELLRRPGDVVTRDELQRQLWTDGTFVDFDEGLNSAVKRLRAALGDSSQSPIYIETVSGLGYRFIAPVSELIDDTEPDLKPKLVPEPKPLGGARPSIVPSRQFSWKRLAPWFGLAIVIVGAATFAVFQWSDAANTSSVPIAAIAVLPLENLSGDASQEYLADGITDEIITDLAKLGGPKVISRTSAMQYKRQHKSIPEIARELNVGAVVEGSLERSGDRVRVRVQLIRATTDQHLWAEEYDRQLSSVLGLEAEVAQDIAEHIQLQLSERQKQELARTHSTTPQAFQDYLQGRHYWALRTKASMNQAIEYFNRAIREDPEDARSYAGLAHCYIVLPMVTLLPQTESLEKAREAGTRAIALDDSLPEAHLAMAEVLLYHDWDFGGAEREFKKTLELNPNYSTAHQWYGEFLSLMGRHQEAIREEQAALALDPLSAVIHHQAGTTLRDAGHYEEAIKQYREALKLNPDFLLAYEAMQWAFRREGKIKESVLALRMAAPGFQRSDYNLTAVISEIDSLETAYNHGGRIAYFRQCLKGHRRATRPHYYLARDNAELGDRNAALAELTASYQDHDIEVLWMLTDPELNSLRSDPRFQRLIRAIGFPH
jgi:TolB-like protein/DNA-binding winged helix-turn-helix (wHTH) protein/Tfp pilus assembly protein PilF